MRRTAAAIVTATVTVVVAAGGGTAQAASPPSGTYPCSQYIYGTGLVGAGVLRIHSKSTYSVNGKKKGTYTTRGKKISFKTGDYSKANRGKWSRKGGEVNIYLFKKSDTKYKTSLLTCSRQ